MPSRCLQTCDVVLAPPRTPQLLVDTITIDTSLPPTSPPSLQEPLPAPRPLVLRAVTTRQYAPASISFHQLARRFLLSTRPRTPLRAQDCTSPHHKAGSTDKKACSMSCVAIQYTCAGRGSGVIYHEACSDVDDIVIHSYHNPMCEYPEPTTIKTFVSMSITVSAVFTITERLTRERIRTTGRPEIPINATPKVTR